jgi:hypothetical protein
MPIILGDSFKDEIEKTHGDRPLIWLVELEVAKPYKSGATVVPSQVVRMTSYKDVVEWPFLFGVFPTFEPYSFTISPIESNSEGDLPQIDLSIDNAARTLMRYLHEAQGCEGNYCKIWLVSESGLEIPHPDGEELLWNFNVSAASANSDVVTFRLEKANFFSRSSPQDRFVAGRCRWQFGGRECGYVINAVAAYSSCPKDLDSCINRGLDHANRGLPVLHPRRFGGFPGIPRQR